MACDISRVIEVARSQIGYLEKATWDDLDSFTGNAGDQNYVKYSRDLYKHNFYNGSKRGIAWCDIFTDWCFVEAYGPNAAQKLQCQPLKSAGAGCRYSAEYYKAKKQWHESSPLPGDQIFFWPSDHQDGDKAMQHTGIVVDVDDEYVYTVEGNTSADSGVVWNGGSVNDKRYKLSYWRIAGYGRPDYKNIDPDPGEEQENLPIYNTSSEQQGGDVQMSYTAIVKPATGNSVNVRVKPNKTASRVPGCESIKAGEQVIVESSDLAWSLISYKGYKGYMMTEFLQPLTGSTNADVDALVSEIMSLVNKQAACAK